MKYSSKTFNPLKSMKKLAICVMLVFVCISANAETKEFDKLSKIKDVEMTHVNKDMIKLAAQAGTGIHLGETINLDDDSGEILNTINDIKIFRCENKKAMDVLKDKTLKLLKAKKWNPLIDTKSEEGQILKIYQAKDGEQNTNVVFVMQEDEAVVVVIDGTFDITKMMGMDNDGDDDNEEDNEEEDNDDEEQD